MKIYQMELENMIKGFTIKLGNTFDYQNEKNKFLEYLHTENTEPNFTKNREDFVEGVMKEAKLKFA